MKAVYYREDVREVFNIATESELRDWNMLLDSSQLEQKEPPKCKDKSSDPDNDGWGWENGRSCVVS